MGISECLFLYGLGSLLCMDWIWARSYPNGAGYHGSIKQIMTIIQELEGLEALFSAAIDAGFVWRVETGKSESGFQQVCSILRGRWDICHNR